MNRNNNNEIITKKDYEILGIKENAKPEEVNSAYEKLCLEYHPKKIRLEKYREPNDLEIKKYKEIEKVYKKFDIEPEKYICCGVKEGAKWCVNEFYPALWIKVEDGQKKYFCSQECYNSKRKSDELVEKWEKEDKEAWEKSLAKLKSELSEKLEQARKEAELEIKDLEPQDRNFLAEINNVSSTEDNFRINKEKRFNKIHAIYERVSKAIRDKAKAKQEKKNQEYCDNCRQEIKKYKDENGHIVSGIGSVDQDGNRHKFCSKECSKKFRGSSKTVEEKMLSLNFWNEWKKRELPIFV